MSLSIIIPCRDEEENISSTIYKLKKKLSKKIKNYEIIIVNDFSEDKTLKICKQFSSKKIIIKNNLRKGLGGAINLGIKSSKKKYVTIMMADLSDSFSDLIKYYKTIDHEDLDAVMGSRFLKKSKISDYPTKKLILNRIFNYFVKIFFFSDYNDFTNAFKIYKQNCLMEIRPLVSENFNIFLEIPLKIITRKKKYKIIPISWKNRKKGNTKFKINELSSKYLFTFIYCWIEKILIK